MKKQKDTMNPPDTKQDSIPPLDIIDLDSCDDIPNSSDSDDSHKNDIAEENKDDADSSNTNGNSTTDKLAAFFSKVNFHIVFLILVVVLIIGIIAKFSDWGVLISQEDIFSDGKGTYDNSYDMILPAFDSNGDPIYPDYSQDLDILVFGNAPFADDRDSEDGLANIIQKETGATIYNCSIGASYLAAFQRSLFPDKAPHDALNLYWLCQVMFSDVTDEMFLDAVARLEDSIAKEAMQIYETMESIDLSDIEVICIMYDGSDYLAGLGMYDDSNPTNIKTFTGNLAASIELIRMYCPHVRIIVMSPPYAYGVDEDGNYISSDIQTYYGQHFLSTYVIKQAEACSASAVTFIDNLYGTITEANADLYLSDNVHLNSEGRHLIADRFIKALYYYQDRN